MSGESAGAIYVHAHLITGPPVKRAVLASGSLYLSSPLPVERGNGLIKSLEAKVQEYGESSLRKASVPALLRALKDSNVNAMWMQEDDELKGWETRIEQADEIMIGDTEYEVCLLSTLHTPGTNHTSLLFGETESKPSMEILLPPLSNKIKHGVQPCGRCTMSSLIARQPANSAHWIL